MSDVYVTGDWPEVVYLQSPHLFGHELLLLARNHFHLCVCLDKPLSGQGCQRKNFAGLNTNMVCVLFVYGLDT